MSYSEKGKGIAGKEECVIVVDGVYTSLTIIICLQKWSYWVRSDPWEGWEIASSQSVLGVFVRDLWARTRAEPSMGRAQSTGGSW